MLLSSVSKVHDEAGTDEVNLEEGIYLWSEFSSDYGITRYNPTYKDIGRLRVLVTCCSEVVVQCCVVVQC